MPHEVLTPGSEVELAAIVRAARAPLTPIGGGTRLRPGEGQRARLSTAALSGITLYEPAALTLVAQAGTPLAEINAVLAAERQRLAFEPDEAVGSTIGGVIAANASGPRRVKDGAARDSLLGVRFVDGRGEVIKNGGRVMKNVTGYDLVKLMAGSRGKLGVLTEVSLKTQPIPPAVATLTVSGLRPDRAVAAMTAALTGPWDVTGAGWLPSGETIVRIEGLEGSVGIRAESLAARLLEYGDITTSQGDASFADLRQMGRIMAGGGALWRIVCRPSQSGEISAQLPGRLAMDWGGALIWAEAPADWTPVLPKGAIATRVSGGAVMDVPEVEPAVARLNAGLRTEFDPRSILAGA